MKEKVNYDKLLDMWEVIFLKKSKKLHSFFCIIFLNNCLSSLKSCVCVYVCVLCFWLLNFQKGF